MIKIPGGLEAASQPYIPDVRRFYMLQKILLAPDDPEPQRPGVVMTVPSEDDDMIVVATRSSTEENGQEHGPQGIPGLNKKGWFSRILPVDPTLWTPENAQSMKVELDEVTFSWIQLDFGL